MRSEYLPSTLRLAAAHSLDIGVFARMITLDDFLVIVVESFVAEDIRWEKRIQAIFDKYATRLGEEVEERQVATGAVSLGIVGGEDSDEEEGHVTQRTSARSGGSRPSTVGGAKAPATTRSQDGGASHLDNATAITEECIPAISIALSPNQGKV